jgi:dolichol-phosphate mannosyltransferase
MKPPRLSVILPCFNEADNIPLWEAELFPVLDRLPFSSECVIVDDGSSDGTFAAAERLAGRRPGIKVVRHEKNRGLGAAIRTGLSAAEGELVLTLDSDLTFSPSLLPSLLEALAPGVDCVCASPFLGRFQGVDIQRRILSAGVNEIYRILLGRPLTAVSSLCRLYRAETLRRLTLDSESFDINAEIIFELLAKGADVREVPAALSVRKFGVSKIRVSREIRNHLLMFARILLWRAKVR